MRVRFPVVNDPDSLHPLLPPPPPFYPRPPLPTPTPTRSLLASLYDPTETGGVRDSREDDLYHHNNNRIKSSANTFLSVQYRQTEQYTEIRDKNEKKWM